MWYLYVARLLAVLQFGQVDFHISVFQGHNLQKEQWRNTEINHYEKSQYLRNCHYPYS